MNKEEILQNYRIEKLKAHHKLDDFNCEKEGLNKFLKEDALEQQEKQFQCNLPCHIRGYNYRILQFTCRLHTFERS
ncbi:MAG: hypothetical protein Q4Q22_04140 [Methanosphaera sp.]|nr:hypothetical protein [Methanosphaera sp.]